MNTRIPLFLFFVSLSMLAHGQGTFYERLSQAAVDLTRQEVEYDPGYFVIAYPNGDIPENKGICTDVLIRAYRKVGIDLQKEIHEDMVSNIKRYTKVFRKAPKPDTNMDHRKVENMMTFFEYHAIKGPITSNPRDFVPGDIVCWDLGKGIRHIGLVSNVKQPKTDRYMVVNNIGKGQTLSDILFAFKMVGHYQYEKKPLVQ